jgi:DNA-binding winged helix-turn-helix (wHTH) protein
LLLLRKGKLYLINKLVEYDPENKNLVNHITGRSIQLQLPANLCFLYLITHPGEIISQNKLMVVGWGERNDVTTPNTFYQAILTLRNALAEVGLPRDTVKTISRRGLMLSEATEVEVFTPTAEPVIANKDVVVANGAARQRPAWLIITTATLLLIALINGGILYKSTRTCRLATTFHFQRAARPRPASFFMHLTNIFRIITCAC